MKIIVEISDLDRKAFAGSTGSCAMKVHELVRREARRLGGPGLTSVEYDDNGRTMREVADPPGIIIGPYETSQLLDAVKQATALREVEGP